VRARYVRVRRKLQKKGTKSAKRHLRKRSGRERRFSRDLNHCLSKAIVQTAKGTQRGIALEDLNGIRERLRAGKTISKRRRRALHNWAFGQLRAFIACKAALAGVVVLVNPAYTSQTCSRCGQREQANRRTQATFICRSCGFSAHADLNAAANIRGRAALSCSRTSQPLAGSGQAPGFSLRVHAPQLLSTMPLACSLLLRARCLCCPSLIVKVHKTSP